MFANSTVFWIHTTQIFVLSLSFLPNESSLYPLKGGNLLISSLGLGLGEIIYTQWGLERVWRQGQPPPSESSQHINELF